jgi:RNA polymerase primary sigma factor
MRQLKITQSITNRVESSLDKYLLDISKLEMIEANDEVNLTKLIKMGDRGALEKMVKANLRFVVSVAKQYQHQGLSLPDLINEGNIGLIKAAQKFDECRGFKFISYAVWWIRQSIMAAIAENSRSIRLPLNQVNLISKINKFISCYEQEFECTPTHEDIASGLDIPVYKVSDIIGFSSKVGVSLDTPVGDDNDSNTLLDLYVNCDEVSTDNSLINESLRVDVEQTLQDLNDRERDIIKMIFGINTREHTLDEIAIKIKLSKERIRQLKESAIKKLRSKKNFQLKTYL